MFHRVFQSFTHSFLVKSAFFLVGFPASSSSFSMEFDTPSLKRKRISYTASVYEKRLCIVETEKNLTRKEGFRPFTEKIQSSQTEKVEISLGSEGTDEEVEVSPRQQDISMGSP